LKQAGKKVILVNCSGSAIALAPETETCEAILQAWYSGESGGQAVADVLFGDYNPSGKLPITFYKNSDKLGDFENYSLKGRTYRFMNDALFPFGFGLSYTNFEIGEPKLVKQKINVNESVELSIPVKNVGKRDGTEIVQVYIRKANDTEGPIKTLKGFQRVAIAAGKEAKANIILPYNSFEFYDRLSGKLAVIPGEYELFCGNSSDSKDLKTIKITVQ
jgi:beta-glucosidase